MAGSVFARAMGEGFARLHPQIQELYGLASEDGQCCRGEGIMDVKIGGLHTRPFLLLGERRNILTARGGDQVPFRVEHYFYRDSFGRETITIGREFDFPDCTRRFDESVVYSEERGRAVAYPGTHQHLAVDMSFEPDGAGGFIMKTGEQRIHEFRRTFRYPRFFSGDAYVHQQWDESQQKCLLDVTLASRHWGLIFSYQGHFDLKVETCSPNQIPTRARPVREEERE